MTDIILKDVTVRAVNVPLIKPIIAHLGTFESWPYLCVDIHTNSELIGRSYIGPYLVNQLGSISKCIKALSHFFLDKKIKPF